MRSQLEVMFRAIVLAMLVSGASTVLEGCTCGSPEAPLQALKSSDAVFVGVPVIIRLREKAVKNLPGKVASARWLEIKFRVSKSWKGVGDGYVSVTTDFQECGFSFLIGESYLVYATYGERHLLNTGQCTRTVQESEPRAGKDMNELGPPVRIFSHEPGEGF